MLAQISNNAANLKFVFQIQPRINLNMHNNVNNFTAICIHISKLLRVKMETKIQDKLANFQVTEMLH